MDHVRKHTDYMFEYHILLQEYMFFFFFTDIFLLTLLASVAISYNNLKQKNYDIYSFSKDRLQ